MQLLPHDEKFFGLLVEQGNIVSTASKLIADGIAGGHSQGVAGKVRELERKGGELFRQINQRLHKSFITPIDAEDIQQLASRIDEILDRLEAVAYCMNAYELERTPKAMAEIANLVNGCVSATAQALESLERDGIKKPDELGELCDEINRRELESEDRVRQAVRELFQVERDAIALIKQKEIYDLFESAADCCKRVSNVLQAVVVKNS